MGKSIIKQKPHWGNRIRITLPYTPAYDGIFEIKASSSVLGYYYTSVEINWCANTGGGTNTVSGFVKKGVRISVAAQSGMGQMELYYTPYIDD